MAGTRVAYRPSLRCRGCGPHWRQRGRSEQRELRRTQTALCEYIPLTPICKRLRKKECRSNTMRSARPAS